jgi:hypothetical protein
MTTVMKVIDTINERIAALTLPEHRRLTAVLLGGGIFLIVFCDMLRHVVRFAGIVGVIVALYVGYSLIERENREYYTTHKAD